MNASLSPVVYSFLTTNSVPFFSNTYTVWSAFFSSVILILNSIGFCFYSVFFLVWVYFYNFGGVCFYGTCGTAWIDGSWIVWETNYCFCGFYIFITWRSILTFVVLTILLFCCRFGLYIIDPTLLASFGSIKSTKSSTTFFSFSFCYFFFISFVAPSSSTWLSLCSITWLIFSFSTIFLALLSDWSNS